MTDGRIPLLFSLFSTCVAVSLPNLTRANVHTHALIGTHSHRASRSRATKKSTYFNTLLISSPYTSGPSVFFTLYITLLLLSSSHSSLILPSSSSSLSWGSPDQRTGGWWRAASLTGGLVSVRWGTWSGNVLLPAQTHSGCYLTRETIRATVFATECGDTLSGCRVVRGTAQAEVRGRDGIRWAWGEGWPGRQAAWQPWFMCSQISKAYALSCFQTISDEQ